MQVQQPAMKKKNILVICFRIFSQLIGNSGKGEWESNIYQFGVSSYCGKTVFENTVQKVKG